MPSGARSINKKSILEESAAFTVDELREKVLDGMGEAYEIMRTYFKLYPCCRRLHAPALAAIELRESHGWEAEDVASICVEGPRFLEMYEKKQAFEHAVKARYSLPYVVAAVSFLGHLGVEAFDRSRRTDAVLLELTDRVEAKQPRIWTQPFPEICNPGHGETERRKTIGKGNRPSMGA